MATITIQLNVACASGDHVRIAVTGDVTHSVHKHVDELFDALSDTERDIVVLGLLKLIKVGKTKAQFKTAITNGVTITV